MIPLATEFKTKMDAKRAILTAANSTGNPDLAKAILLGLLRVLEQEMERALMNRDNAPTSVQISVDPAILSHPALAQVRQYLVNLGYTVAASNGVATISW